MYRPSRQCCSQGLWPKDKDKDLRSEDHQDKEKDLSVYANWITAGNLFAIKIKIVCAQ